MPESMVEQEVINIGGVAEWLKATDCKSVLLFLLVKC